MIAGIVCEYNPFHKGHLYQLEKTKQAGATAVVCVMSGNFVQRGECAFLDKWTRAEIAVKNGADVVIDLPVPWAVSSAENFARGSIFLLREFGIDFLSFGSECDSKDMLLTAAESTQNEEVIKLTKKYMSEGMSYPLSLSLAVEKIYGRDISGLIASPNSTLGIEYIKQLNSYGIDFLPVERKGAAHDSKEESEFLSASKIRGDASSGEDILSLVPKIGGLAVKGSFDSGFAPCLMKNAERAILSTLRGLSLHELERCISDSTGLASRMYEATKTASSLEELYSLAKSKNYTHSRVRREVLNAYLGIDKELAKDTPTYIRILAVSKKGLSLLSKAKKNSALPIVTKHGEMQKLCEKSKYIYELQCSCTDKFALFSPMIRPCGLEQKNPMIIIK